MKKLNYLLLGAAGLLLASCSNEDLVNSGTNGEPSVTFDLSIPQIQTRAYSDGTKALRLQYAVYDSSTDNPVLVENLTDETVFDNLQAKVNVVLANGHTYDFIFWASTPLNGNEATNPYTVEFEENGATVTVDYTKLVSNNEAYDAFYLVKKGVKIEGPQTVTAKLQRPFAQVNLLTSDYEQAKNVGYEPDYSKVVVSELPTTLDLFSGETSGSSVEVKFDYAGISRNGEGLITSEKPSYEFLNMIYVLAGAEQDLVDLKYSWKQGENGVESSLPVGSVPVQRNHRTNIYGALLTNPIDINVEILPDFDSSENIFVDKEIFNGVTYDASIKTFYISNADGLVWLSNVTNEETFTVNENSPYTVDEIKTLTKNGAFSGLNVLFTSDIDMNGREFTPIHLKNSSSSWFDGNIDGQGHTFKNLSYTSTVQGQAVGFVSQLRGNIQNVKIDKANFTGLNYIGGVVGGIYGNIINCEVSNSVLTANYEESTMAEGADIGGILGFLRDSQGYIQGCKVTNTIIKGCRDIGGVVGKYQGYASSTTNKIVDCELTNVNILVSWPEGYTEGGDKNDPNDKIYNRGTNQKETFGVIAGFIMYDHAVPSTNLDGSANPDNNILNNVTLKVCSNGENVFIPASQQEMTQALNALKDGDVVVLPGDDFVLPTAMPTNKSYTLTGLGAENTLVVLTDRNAYNTATDASITFENLTLKVFSDANGDHKSMGFKQAKEVNFKNVKVIGQLHIFIDSKANFENCEFNYAPTNNSPNLLWIETNKETVIKDCLFYHSVGSLALLVCLNNNDPSNMGDITIENCKFSAASSMARAAVEIHSENFASAGTLTMKGCENVNDVFPYGLWREIVNTATSSNGDKGTHTNFYKVVIDGETIQDGSQKGV